MVTLSEKLKLRGVINSAEVKSLYEDNNDTNAYTDAEKTKLAGVATGATANDTDDNLLNRANHTGTQLASTISDFDTEVSNNSSVVANTAKVSADGSIATHSDVDLTGIGINQVLKWDGSKFVPSVDDDDFVGVTNLSYTASETDGTIVSDTGQNAAIIAGSTIYASLMLPGDKTKLDGIATGAEVNIQSDWNAVSGDAFILNKPTLGTASIQDVEYFATAAQGTLANTALQSNDIADFETTTQLNTRDTANRNRANHTGTQAISTVDGLQVALDGKEPADATILKDGDIGITVQGYDANTVIDANYVATENSYTTTEKNKLAGIEAGATADQTGAEIKTLYEAEADTNAYTDAEKTKLAGIASGAEVNVQSDWDAISGDAQILNKPTVYTTTNSATPPAGAIEGDTWWDSETGEKFIYYNDGDTLQWVQVSNTNNLVLADVGTAAYADVEDFIPSADSGNYVQTTGDQSIAGTKTFTTALILPNNSRINGVEHFYQTTKPTVRGDATALVAGDRWWKTDDGTEWFWNGTYWLEPFTISIENLFTSTHDYFLESFVLNVSSFSGHDESNYYYYKVEVIGTRGSGNADNFIIDPLGDTINLTDTWEQRIFPIGIFMDTVLSNGYKRTRGLYTRVKVGNPPTSIADIYYFIARRAFSG